MNRLPPTPNWIVIKLLWRAARRRTAGRKKRQAELMSMKKGKGTDLPKALALGLMILFMSLVHAGLGWFLISTGDEARIVDAERNGKLVVSLFLSDSLWDLSAKNRSSENFEERCQWVIEQIAYWRQRERGGTIESQEQLVKSQYDRYGVNGFIADGHARFDSSYLPPTYWPVAGFILLWWLAMIVCQGEGLELDIQRRRHPMWEWLQTHPVQPIATFAADLLSPMMANPVYFTAPIFWWVVLGSHVGVLAGLLGGLVIGLLVACAASSLHKAVETVALLRLDPRNRGAVLGLISWFGYAAMMLPLFVAMSPLAKFFLVKTLAPLGDWLPQWPVRALVFGWGDQPVLWQVLLSGTLFALSIAVGAVAIAWWGVSRGLQAPGGASAPPRRLSHSSTGFFAKYPLYRKELLWFWRDRGAVVQSILIPLTLASFQVMNLRGLIAPVIGTWNGICGAAILCGTYFLVVLGPRSLASEGAALWIATTWPLGLESLLKAKARLWWFVASLIVGMVMIFAVFLFPADWWRIALAGGGWLFFGHSLAEKTVTLVSATSSSGEPEPVPQGRQWTAMLGTLTFSSGVISGNWSIAMVGVVFSSLTAAAIWQNFRERLPFLFDPWSEKLPPAPSLMHAMIGIAAMVEVISLATVLMTVLGGQEHRWLISALVYGLVGIVAMVSMQSFLDGRGVKIADIYRWTTGQSRRQVTMAYGTALLIGVSLSGMAMLYLMGLRAAPLTHDWMREVDRLSAIPGEQRLWVFALTVCMAPVAEEYFFRGLLYRALDREWGGISAVVGSSLYFTIYHPPVSWLPVFGVGICSAWLFKKTGLLGPCVLLHMTYNALLLLLE